MASQSSGPAPRSEPESEAESTSEELEREAAKFLRPELVVDGRTPWQAFLTLPLMAGVAAWAAGHFWRSALGGWRYIIVVPLALYAVYMGIMAVIAGLVALVVWLSRDATPSWMRSGSRYLLGALIGAFLLSGFVIFVSDLGGSAAIGDVARAVSLVAGGAAGGGVRAFCRQAAAGSAAAVFP